MAESATKWDMITRIYKDLGIKHVLNGLKILTIPFQYLARIERKIRKNLKTPHCRTFYSGYIYQWFLLQPQWQI